VTKPKTKRSAVAELTALEEAWSAAEAEATRLAREHFQAQKRLHGYDNEPGLFDLRRRLEVGEPAQFDEDGSAKGGKAKSIDKEIAAVGDLGPLAQRVEHARRVAARAKADVDTHVREHLAAILEGLRPAAQAKADAANAAGQAFAAALSDYLGHGGRTAALIGTIRGADNRIPGYDAAAELKRLVERLDLPAPLPS
jgi:hypothetical protein